MDLQRLENLVDSANASLDHACLNLWPVGSDVLCNLRSGQINPTAGTVLGVSGGVLRIELATRNRRGNHTIKRVHWSSIL